MSPEDDASSPPPRAENRLPPPDPGEATAAVRQGFEAARTAAPDTVRTARFRFADRIARFEVVGPDLARRIFRPFGHLRESDDAPGEVALSVELWDEAETGVECPGVEPDPDLGRLGSSAPGPDGWTVAYRRPQALVSFDRRAGRLTGWVHDSTRFTLYELGRPLHPQLLLWYRDQGLPALHAGLVAQGDRGVLLAGSGGSGKSTSAVTCLLDGFRYLSDDYVGLEARDDGTFVGHSLYSSCHLEPDHLQTFPDLASAALHGSLPDEDKALILLDGEMPERLARRATITSVVLPRVTGAEEPRLRKASSAEALLRLAPSSLLMIPHAAGDLDPLADLVETVPSWWLELGGHPDRIPQRIHEVLGASGGPPAEGDGVG